MKLFPRLPMSYEKSRQFAVADLALLLSWERQARDALVGENLALVSHGTSTDLVWV
jgi:hypothetical protein